MIIADLLMEAAKDLCIPLDREEALRYLKESGNVVDTALTRILNDRDVISSPATPPSRRISQHNPRIFSDSEDDDDDDEDDNNGNVQSKRFRPGTPREVAAADVGAFGALLVDTPPPATAVNNAGDILSPILASASLGPSTATDAAASSTSPVQDAAAAKSTAPEGDKKLSDDEDDEDYSDIPPEADSANPITLNDGDIECSFQKGTNGKVANAPLLDLIKSVRSRWENAVPDGEKKNTSRLVDLAAYIKKNPKRKEGWKICYDLLRDHPGRFYVKNDSGLCYEVSKTNTKLLEKVWNSLVIGKFELGPTEIPPEAISPNPIAVNAGDIEWTYYVGSAKRDRSWTTLMRTAKTAWDEAVPEDERKPKNSANRVSFEDLVDFFDKNPNRKDGWGICIALLQEHPGRFYVKNDISGHCYEVSKTNPKLLERAWSSLCRTKLSAEDLVAEEQAHCDRITAYLTAVSNGEDPPLREDISYVVVRAAVGEVISKAAALRVQNQRERGILPPSDAMVEAHVPGVGERLIDDMRNLARSKSFEPMELAGRKSILRVLGGVESQDDDGNDPRYNGFIITDLQTTATRLGFVDNKKGTAGGQLLNRVTRGWLKHANCNPRLTGQRLLKKDDVFIMHNENIYGGKEGKKAVKEIRAQKKKVYK